MGIWSSMLGGNQSWESISYATVDIQNILQIQETDYQSQNFAVMKCTYVCIPCI